MNFYKKNVMAVKERFGFDFETEFPKDDTFEAQYYHVEDTKTGNKTLKFVDGSKKMYVHSKFDPVREGKLFAEKYKSRIEGKNIIVLFGFGFGYTVREFLKIMKPNNILVIFDPSWHILKLSIENLDISDIIMEPRVSFLIGKNFPMLEDLLRDFITEENFENLVYVTNPFYKERYSQEHKIFTETLLTLLKQYRLSVGTAGSWGAKWTSAIINNAKYMITDNIMNDFKQILPDRPVIMVAAGPSLDKNIELLKQVQGKITIVCVYTAYRALLKHNIRPDFVVTLDADQTMFETDEDKEEIFDPAVVYLCVANTQLIDRFKGGRIYCQSQHDSILKNLLTDKMNIADNIFIGGSVSVSALHFCYYLGGNPIIMLGLDLAMDSEKSHASGTIFDYNEEAEKSEIDDKIILVEGINGKKIRTNLLLEDYKRHTEKLIRIFLRSTYIDATEGGAFIKGSIVDTFENVINTYLPAEEHKEDINEIFKRAFDIKSPYTREDLEIILKNTIEQKDLMYELAKHLKEGLELSVEVLNMYTFGNPGNKAAKEIIDKFYELDEKVNDIMGKTSLFGIMTSRINFLLNADQPSQDEKSEIYFGNHSRLLYRELAFCTNDLQKGLLELSWYLSDYLEVEISDGSKDITTTDTPLKLI